MRKKTTKKIFKSMLFCSMLFFFYTSLSRAQKIQPVRSHPLAKIQTARPNVPDTLTIVAVRVEFQPDNNRFTTGNGTFNSGNLSFLNSPEITIDPLPHDKAYFEAHLQFAKNYFETVSGQQIFLRYRVLPEIYQLPKRMENYSPTGRTFTTEKVAHLAKDTWQTVEEQGGFSTENLDPQKTAFIIFHAGVGRDIELTGTTLDKTPQDIPSLFLSKNAFADLLNNPNFNGFEINNGSFRIINSIILPRTLSRRGEDFSGDKFVLQLSLNGLLCASIGSYLGLPDLFNTNTGSSGIGRFGLMDGESFFSYRGLFPPEPSAWEKIYLGWQAPFEITANTGGLISLAAASFHQNKSIAKYSLSGSEYFLIENRHRDPNGGGVTLTVRQPDGTIATQHFDNTDEDFVYQTQGFTDLLAPGVVTNVSNFDWSLPGGIGNGPDGTANTADDKLLNGGILIWHIDQAVIQHELQNRTVNANPDRRGVDLEEADGAQDIGRAAGSNFDTQARGTAFDFWWKGNYAAVITQTGDTLHFYENRFAPDTRPSNESNSSAASFFEFYDFSENLPVASFRVRPYSENHIQPKQFPPDLLPAQPTFTSTDEDYFSSWPLSLSIYRSPIDSFLIIPTRQSTYALNLSDDSNFIFDFQSGLIQQPYLGNSLILANKPQVSQIALTSRQWDGSNWNILWKLQANSNKAFISSLNDQVLQLDFTNQQVDISSGTLLPPLSNFVQHSTVVNGNHTTINENMLRLMPEDDRYSIPNSNERLYTGLVEITQNKTVFYLLTDDDLMLFDPQNFNQPKYVVRNTPLDWPAFADINRDGNMDFIYVNKETKALEARNIDGAMLSHFPIRPPDGTSFIGTPLVVIKNKIAFFITSQDSLSMNIEGFSATGEQLKGFPLYVGAVSEQENQPIHPIISGQTLFAIDHHGQLKAWRLENVDQVLWGSRYGNHRYNKVNGRFKDKNLLENPAPAQQILVKSETYNWPNPAYDFTHLRFQTRGAGKVNVKIITTGGTIIFDEQFQSEGTVPEDHRISTVNWASGLYLAMITATVNGKRERKMLKIVVIH